MNQNNVKKGKIGEKNKGPIKKTIEIKKEEIRATRKKGKNNLRKKDVCLQDL